MDTLIRSFFAVENQKYIFLGLIVTVSVGVLTWPWGEFQYEFEYQKLAIRLGLTADLPSKVKYSLHRNITADLSYFQYSMMNHDHAFPNSLYRCGPSPTGPICHGVHISKETMQKSMYTASGDGLYRANVGQPASIRINVGHADPLPLFSVLAVGKHHLFTVPPSPIDKSGGHINFTYIPTFPGEYDLIIEHINGSHQRQVSDSPYRLVVEGSISVVENFRKRADTLPSCQTVPQYNHSWVHGEWVSREFAGRHRGTLRNGWVLQPNHCSFDIFTTEDLQRAASMPKPRTIVILGRSTERGIFLSLVDIALRMKEKINFAESKIGQCWGFVEVQLGNIRFIYQDYHLEQVNMDSIKNGEQLSITCHNEKKITNNNDFFSDAIGFLQEFLFADRLWPDVILLSVEDKLQLKLIMKAIPASWKGIIYPTRNFKAFLKGLYTAKGRQEDIGEMESFASLDNHIRVLDAFAVAEKSRHGTQTSPVIMRSLHWHKWCSELNGEIRVCGDATEMMAQILLGVAIAPDGKDAWLDSLSSRDVIPLEAREIQICHDCPQALAPVHIKRNPKLKCYKTKTGLRRQEKKDIQVWDGSLCPKDCMITKPVRHEQTVSGPADVRICTMLAADET